jgi:hypothetical protein
MSITIGPYDDFTAPPVDPNFPLLGGPVVIVGNNTPGPAGDLWTIAGLQNFDLFDSPIHRCDLFWFDASATNLLDTSYLANDTTVGWTQFPPFLAGILTCGDPDSSGNGALFGLITSFNVSDAATCVDIDLKPESDPNCLNPNSRGRTSVAVLGSEDFDVLSVDPSTLAFGGASADQCGLDDSAPADGILDLACRYRVRDIGLPAAGSDCGDVSLTGALVDGTEIEGSDLACIPGEPTCEAGTGSQ